MTDFSGCGDGSNDVVPRRAQFIEVGVHEEFQNILEVSSSVSTVALLARVAKSETELIHRAAKPLLALLKETLPSGGSEDHFIGACSLGHREEVPCTATSALPVNLRQQLLALLVNLASTLAAPGQPSPPT